MHVSDISIYFLFDSTNISDIGVRLLLLCEVVRSVVSLILSLYQGSLELPSVFGTSWILEMNHVIAAMRELSQSMAKQILHQIESLD